MGRRERASSSAAHVRGELPSQRRRRRRAAASCTSRGTRAASSGERSSTATVVARSSARARVPRQHARQVAPVYRGTPARRPAARGSGRSGPRSARSALRAASSYTGDARQRRSVERRGAHRAREAPQVDLRERGAVRAAVEVDAAVAERLPDALEIGRGGRLVLNRACPPPSRAKQRRRYDATASASVARTCSCGQATLCEPPVPRWSTSTMSRNSLTFAKISLTETAASSQLRPGRPRGRRAHPGQAGAWRG